MCISSSQENCCASSVCSGYRVHLENPLFEWVENWRLLINAALNRASLKKSPLGAIVFFWSSTLFTLVAKTSLLLFLHCKFISSHLGYFSIWTESSLYFKKIVICFLSRRKSWIVSSTPIWLSRFMSDSLLSNAVIEGVKFDKCFFWQINLAILWVSCGNPDSSVRICICGMPVERYVHRDLSYLFILSAYTFISSSYIVKVFETYIWN